MSVIPVYNCFHPILKQKAERVENIDDETRQFVHNMIDTMYKADGIGLAANQVGDRRAIITIDVNAGDEELKGNPIVLINPEIVSFSEEESDYQEGCLSIPKYYENVIRPKNVQLRYYDLEGKEYNVEADELLSRVAQHEIDHLNGILFFERISPLKRALAKNKLKKIKRGDVVPHYDMVLPDGTFVKGEDD